MKKLAVLTGAGISAESGISTFRDIGGLWEQHNVMDVASIEGWHRNPALVLDFYNARRRDLAQAQPNAAHKILHDLEEYFDVCIITQNVDDLHERAGSAHIIHLHGELTKARSTDNPRAIYDIGYGSIHIGDADPHGSQLRPHIVWFGEAVPMLEAAAEQTAQADIAAIIGTSMNVYPAAGLIHYRRRGIPVFLIDPNDVSAARIDNLSLIKEKATTGAAVMRSMLMEMFYGKGI